MIHCTLTIKALAYTICFWHVHHYLLVNLKIFHRLCKSSRYSVWNWFLQLRNIKIWYRFEWKRVYFEYQYFIGTNWVSFSFCIQNNSLSDQQAILMYALLGEYNWLRSSRILILKNIEKYATVILWRGNKIFYILRSD